MKLAPQVTVNITLFKTRVPFLLAHAPRIRQLTTVVDLRHRSEPQQAAAMSMFLVQIQMQQNVQRSADIQ
jgi:hypothetical protein